MAKKSKKIKKIKDLMSEMSKYLKDAGFIEASQKLDDAMNAMDGFGEDMAYDMVPSTPDVQNALPGSMPVEMTGEVAGGMQGAFSIPEAERIASLANRLDKLGYYDEANELDDMLKEMPFGNMTEIIDDLEKSEDKKKSKKVKDDEEDKEGVDAVVNSNGHVLTDVSQHSGFNGLSDAYMYSGYGNLEPPYGPIDR